MSTSDCADQIFLCPHARYHYQISRPPRNRSTSPCSTKACQMLHLPTSTRSFRRRPAISWDNSRENHESPWVSQNLRSVLMQLMIVLVNRWSSALLAEALDIWSPRVERAKPVLLLLGQWKRLEEEGQISCLRRMCSLEGGLSVDLQYVRLEELCLEHLLILWSLTRVCCIGLELLEQSGYICQKMEDLITRSRTSKGFGFVGLQGTDKMPANIKWQLNECFSVIVDINSLPWNTYCASLSLQLLHVVLPKIEMPFLITAENVGRGFILGYCH